MTYLPLITPTNIAEEKAKFFRSATYSPQLTYRWNDAFVTRFRAERPELGALATTLLRQDVDRIMSEASRYFDVLFRPEDIGLAHTLVQTAPPASNGTAEELAALLVSMLRQLEIDYAVKVVDRQGFQCRPDHRYRVVRVSKHLHLQFYTTESVAVHELVHIVRAVNGSYNHIPQQSDYLPTEEGLACLAQDKLLRQPSPASFQHALEYLAAYLSQTHGFRDIYTFLRDHGCDAENAWLRGIRQKFGLCDTSRPGGLLKSGMYFYHEQLLRMLSTDELLRLFVGKITPRDLEHHKHYAGAVPRQAIEALLGYAA